MKKQRGLDKRAQVFEFSKAQLSEKIVQAPWRTLVIGSDHSPSTSPHLGGRNHRASPAVWKSVLLRTIWWWAAWDSPGGWPKQVMAWVRRVPNRQVSWNPAFLEFWPSLGLSSPCTSPELEWQLFGLLTLTVLTGDLIVFIASCVLCGWKA